MRLTPPGDMLDYLDSIGVQPPENPSKSKPSAWYASSLAMGCLLFYAIPSLLLTLGFVMRWLGILSISMAIGLYAQTAYGQESDAANEIVSPQIASPKITLSATPHLPKYPPGSHDVPSVEVIFPYAPRHPVYQPNRTSTELPMQHQVPSSTSTPTMGNGSANTPRNDIEWLRFSYVYCDIAVGMGLLICVLICTWRACGRSQNNGQDKSSSAIARTAANEPHAAAMAMDESVAADPTDGTMSWQMGVCSSQGNVRRQNQDYAIAFMQEEQSILIIADGCGGIPFGAEASRVAAEACAGAMRQTDAPPLVSIQQAFEGASQALLGRGTELHVQTLEGGLRTTLIVVIATEDLYYFGYIGDGALQILRTNGVAIHCLVPQRASIEISNVLSASLGPVVQGNAQFGTVPRLPGDLLLAGTDGVFDRVGDDFAYDVMRMAIFQRGNLQRASEAIVEQLAQTLDSDGKFVCDDNLTLGLIAGGRHPELAPEFWRASKVFGSRLE